jgi:hypothetical protein
MGRPTVAGRLVISRNFASAIPVASELGLCERHDGCDQILSAFDMRTMPAPGTILHQHRITWAESALFAITGAYFEFPLQAEQKLMLRRTDIFARPTAGNLINCKVPADKACETNNIGAGGR